MRPTCGVYTTEERGSIACPVLARPVLDACVDDVEVEGEDMLKDILAHGGGFGFGLIGQRIEV